MIALLWSMLRARRLVAVVMFVVTMAAAAAAATGPLYRQAATGAIGGVEAARAPVTERVVSAQRIENERSPAADNQPPTLPHLTGFRTVTGRQMAGVVRGAPGADRSPGQVWLVSRSGFCAEVTLTAGRCAVADHEVLVRADTAQSTGLRVGDEVLFSPEYGGAPVRLTVVGLYAKPAAEAVYWAARPSLVGTDTGALLVTDRTLTRAGRSGLSTVDLVAGPAGFADLPRLRAELDPALGALLAADYAPATDLRDLLDRIEQARRVFGDSLTVAVLPLVSLCWFVLFLAAAGAAERRRDELGLAVLRGVPARLRWLLPSVETTVPMLLAAGPGYLVGLGATALIAAWALPQAAPVTPSGASLGYAGVAVLGALVAGLLAQVRLLTSPLLSLLRRVTGKRRSGLVGAAEVVVGALAIAAGYQVSLSSDGPNGGGGVALLAPLCISLGLGLVASRAVVAPAAWLGRWALRRGRLSLGVAALTLARRPESNRIVALLTVAFGLIGFAVAAGDTANRAWTQRAQVETGAARVLSVAPIPVPTLLAAVRTADPQGAYAMSAAHVTLAGAPPVLGVDSARLAQVASWSPDFGPVPPAELARRLRPAAPEPLTFRAAQLDLAVTVVDIEPGATAYLGLRLTAADGAVLTVRTGQLRPGEHRYPVPVPQCAQGPCRLDEIGPELSSARRHRVDLVLGPILDGTDGTMLVDAARMAEPDRWRQPTSGVAKPVPALRRAPGGLGMAVDSTLRADLRVFPAAVPEPLPMVATVDLPADVPGNGGARQVGVARVGTAELVPRFGATGALVDLEYAGDVGLEIDSDSLQVWLSATAPADAVERLRDAGLTVTDARTVAARRAALGSQGPAFALRFLLVAALAAVLLAMGGIVVTAVLERGHRLDGLAALREQGVRARTLRAVDVLRRCGLVLLAAVLGLAAATASWLFAREVLPVYLDTQEAVVPPPVVPSLVGAVPPLAAAVVVLLVTCWVASRVAGGGREGLGG